MAAGLVGEKPEMLTVVFRVDASLEIGTGHVMRCLTLADALRQKGALCHFICREHPGNLISEIRQRDYPVYVLPARAANSHPVSSGSLENEHWLQVSWAEDAAQSYDAMRAQRLHADWLIVDHYAIDSRWQTAMKDVFNKLFVIDDLADRGHVADLLLDQNLGRTDTDYDGRIPDGCVRLIGPEYALLRPEFTQWREYSLNRREHPELRNILVSMGGIDKDNTTSLALEALRTVMLPRHAHIRVIMGSAAPWLEVVRKFASDMPVKTTVYVKVENMAQMMADSDFAIGGAGTTTWERCVLGLPSMLFVLAQNQRELACAVQHAGAAVIGEFDRSSARLIAMMADAMRSASLVRASRLARGITDGRGAHRVVATMMGKSL